RSWMWRLVFVKLVLALVCTWTIPLPVLPGRGSDDRTAQRIVTESTEVAANLQSTMTAELSATPTVAAGRSLWATGLCGLWAIGVLVQAGYLVHRWQAIGRQIARARRTPIADLSLQRLFTALLPRFGLRRSSRLCISSNIGGPCVYGMNRPIVFIPNSWRETCSSEQLQIVMAHELAHVERHDLRWNLGIVACRVALFFHPLVWLAAQRYLAAQELACDELALRRTGRSPVILSRLLLKFVDDPAVTEWPNAAAMVGASSTLRERIVAMNRNLLGSASRTAVVLVVTAGVLLLAPFTLADQGSTGSPKDPPSKNRPNSTGNSASANASAAASGNDVRTQASANVQLGLPAPAKNENPQSVGDVSDRNNPLPPMNPSVKNNSTVKQTATSQNGGDGEDWKRV
ncbi:MAG: M56 family metallopeptidase, partial [Caldilineaceae bacterium]|nr:M56 family metallopeptidase [Caldilineaceae bacterium]